MYLEVKNIHKSFHDKEILHGISFQVFSGKALGLLGRNGAGKTTILRILMGVLRQEYGEILLNNNKFELPYEKIGYLPEERGLYPKRKVLEQLVYFGRLRGLSKRTAVVESMKWLERLEVEQLKDKKLEVLSKGTQQKIQLAQTLICNPEIVIFDEPFSGLDPVNSQLLKNIIHDLIHQDKVVIFSSHQMNYIEEFCHDVVLIHHGKIIMNGNLKEIKKSYQKNQIVYADGGRNIQQLAKNIKEVFHEELAIKQIREEDVVLEITSGKTREEILSYFIREKFSVYKFESYEPSLEEIFIEKVGENR